MIKEALIKVVDREDLSQPEMEEVMREIMDGEATPALIAAFVTALRMKGETIDEITGAAKVMRKKAERIPLKSHPVSIDHDDINLDMETILDTCGTGGDGTKTFNISTTCAFVAAGAGLKVAKHGNRAVSSCSGSADVLVSLGVNIELTPENVGRCVDEVGIGFLYAPLLHSAMKHALIPRREIGIRTIFNVLGPLTNPAKASAQVLGVYEEVLTEKLAHVLLNLGARRGMVVHGMDGLDEITITRESRVSEINGAGVHTWFLDPRDYGFTLADADDLLGGSAEENAAITRYVLDGGKGAKRDIVLLNSGAAIYVGGKASSLADGIKLAAESIDSGAAMRKLDELVTLSKELAA
ncbi:MAG: anthranilate phosphoribosyltransferase [Nitrospirae bacterium]|nr:anthranilate phosphoribosyltransferase [Nitrospirota bacterium]MBI5695798.1 anthranilate phosphoribosyltransferase [Nitrospirota bacterium]